MKKVISFSLYGSKSEHTQGIICNVELAKIIYPEWVCRIYYGESVPKEIIDILKEHENVEMVLMPEGAEYLFSMMWRFLAIDDDDVEISLSRDADSRLSYREKACVDIFMESDKLLHSIRDNKSHNNIMGGMWGIKKNIRVKMKDLTKDWVGGVYDYDQKFLREILVPYFEDSYMIHCSNYLNNFPIEKQNEHFIGDWWPADNFGNPNNFIFM
jgi:hypothetical protein